MFGPWFTGSLPDVEPRQWQQRLRCFSLGMFPAGNKLQYERGDKILLPASALHKLTNQRGGVMLFKLEHNERVTHCGVLEFSAVEGHMYIPFWMMANLCLEEGGIVQVSSAKLSKAEFTKIQPMETEFLRLANPKAVLEHELRHFTCLTQGDQITIQYAGDRYNIHIKELWPAAACCIVDTDCKVDFEAPPGYVAPKPSSMLQPEPTEPTPPLPTEPPKGRRVDGKPVTSSVGASKQMAPADIRRKRIERFSKLKDERFAGKGHTLKK